MRQAHPAMWRGDRCRWVVGEVLPSRWVESDEGVVPCGVGSRAVRASPEHVGTAIPAEGAVSTEVLGGSVPGLFPARCGSMNGERVCGEEGLT